MQKLYCRNQTDFRLIFNPENLFKKRESLNRYLFSSFLIYLIDQNMDYDWYELNSNKYRFKADLFSENSFGKRFNRLNHEYMLISVASYGGPIAVTSDKTKILTLREDDPSIENICIFSNEGDIVQRIKLGNPFQNVIVCMEFIKDEYLLVLFQKGDIWLINPHSAEIKKLNAIGMLQGELFVLGKTFDNGFAVETTMRRFLFVRNVLQPQLVQFFSCEQQLKKTEQKPFWRVFSPRMIISEKVELHITHPSAGIIQVVEGDGKRIFYNQEKGGHIVESKLPHLKAIKFISNLSPNNKYITYFSAEPLFKESPTTGIPQDKKGPVQPRVPYAFAYRLIIAPSISSDSLEGNKFKLVQLPFVKEGTHINLDQQPIDVKWCGNRAVVIQFQNQQLYLCSIAGDLVKIEKDRGEKEKWSFLKEQLDGTRIISKKDNKILREIPSAFASVFQSFSEEPGALLRAAYIAFEDQEPLQDDQIRKEKDRLAKGVDQCLASARFDLNFETVSQLMRAAAYGKAFLPPNMVNNNDIYETTKLLRICNQLRSKLMRYITYEQLKQMGDEQLLKILLRYQEHYLAFEIYQYLKKDQNFRVKIYTDWACCKVQNQLESEDEICQSIRTKLQNQKGISFTEIAHRSIEIGRSELAMKLLEFQPSLAKKVPLLLWIGNREDLSTCHKFYEKSIEEALKSRDLNLLYLAIKRIIASQKLSEYQIFELFSKNIEGIYALVNYYKMFDRVNLIKYYDFLKLSEAKIMEFIKIALASQKYEDMQKFLYSVSQYFQNFQSNLQNQWRRPIFKKLFQNFNQFLKHNATVKYASDKMKPMAIGRQLQIFMQKGDRNAVDDLKKEYDISDKRVIMAKIRSLIDTKKWEQVHLFVERHQKEFKIPAELIADLLMERGEMVWAMKMMAKMPPKKKDEQYLLLQRIGKYKEVIDLAADRKDVEALEEIHETLLDPTLLAYCNEKMSLLKRK